MDSAIKFPITGVKILTSDRLNDLETDVNEFIWSDEYVIISISYDIQKPQKYDGRYIAYINYHNSVSSDQQV